MIVLRKLFGSSFTLLYLNKRASFAPAQAPKFILDIDDV